MNKILDQLDGRVRYMRPMKVGEHWVDQNGMRREIPIPAPGGPDRGPKTLFEVEANSTRNNVTCSR